MPYSYGLVTTAAATAVITVASATAGKRTVKTASYAVGGAGKSLCETVYDTVASANASVIITVVATAIVVTATAVVGNCSVTATAIAVAEVIVVLTAAAAVVLISDGTSAAAYVSCTV